MEPYQERVVLEKQELDAKLGKLTAFLGHDVFRTVDAAEQDRLQRQWDTMRAYSAILAERIEAFR